MAWASSEDLDLCGYQTMMVRVFPVNSIGSYGFIEAYREDSDQT